MAPQTRRLPLGCCGSKAATRAASPELLQVRGFDTLAPAQHPCDSPTLLDKRNNFAHQSIKAPPSAAAMAVTVDSETTTSALDHVYHSRVHSERDSVSTSPCSTGCSGQQAHGNTSSKVGKSNQALSRSGSNLTRGLITFEMSCDMLCVRTMTVSYTDHAGRRQQCSQTGYNAKVHLLPSCRDIQVSFSVMAGGQVYKVDRNVPGAPWVKDVRGQYVPEKFVYHSDPPQHIQYFICGPSFHSWVSRVDERDESQSLLELVSKDYACIRTMHVRYTDRAGLRQKWSGTGYHVKCHLPSDSRNVEVTFSVVGGSKVQRVDRRDPALPWVIDANGRHPAEKFVYQTCPPSVQYDVRGTSLFTYISGVHEQRSVDETDEPDLHGANATNEDLFDEFNVSPQEVPSIGGIVELSEPHSEFLLPAEVVLYEPTQADIFHSASGMRQIFLNVRLTQQENDLLREMHKLVQKRGLGGPNGEFPRYMEQHALRMLQTSKFKVSKAVDMMNSFRKERVRRLPLQEDGVKRDLQSGWIYWHGRDRSCRPCLVIRLDRLGELGRDRERTVRTVIFTLEYALRYAMVPGRVENWVVIIDLVNVMSAINPLHFTSLIGTATAIGATLEKIYCGRMGWIRIVNMPGGAFVNKLVTGTIPSEKRDKVMFPMDIGQDLSELFEPNQLERKYGGLAPDLQPHEVYPYKFFPNARGLASNVKGVDGGEEQPKDGTPEEVRESEAFSLHHSTSLFFHEGLLWDESCPLAKQKWAEEAKKHCLTPYSAKALSEPELSGEVVQPVRDMHSWLARSNPAAMRHQKHLDHLPPRTTTSTTRTDPDDDDSHFEDILPIKNFHNISL